MLMSDSACSVVLPVSGLQTKTFTCTLKTHAVPNCRVDFRDFPRKLKYKITYHLYYIPA